MTTLITGGSKCGKSTFAEKLLSSHSGRKIYIATLRPYGNNAEDIIARHIKMREGKCFVTIEQFTDINKAPVKDGDAVLLEDIGNLAANEMFTENGIVSPVTKVVSGIKTLSETVAELIIVTNEVGCDGIGYASGTMDYIDAVSSINRSIAEFADNVYECVYGIPVTLKGEKIC